MLFGRNLDFAIYAGAHFISWALWGQARLVSHVLLSLSLEVKSKATLAACVGYLLLGLSPKRLGQADVLETWALPAAAVAAFIGLAAAGWDVTGGLQPTTP